jgi:hypothetical protein
MYVEALRKNRREDESHAPVIERPTRADQRQSMVALVLINVLMQYYDRMPSLEKMSSSFFILSKRFYFFCAWLWV